MSKAKSTFLGGGTSFLGTFVVVVWVFGGYLVCFVPENRVFANFCLALSSGVTIGFLGFISAGAIKVGFAIST